MRRNIGFLIDDINNPFTQKAIKGAELAAIALDADLYVFPGMYLGVSDHSENYMQYGYQYNTLFQFANTKKLDILYVMMDTIGAWINQRGRERFLKQFLDIPVVTLFTSVAGYHAVIFDNETSFMQEIRHLIVDHHAKKIGYVSGPKGNIDASERLSAFRKVLAEHQIPYDETNVIYGSFAENSEPLIDAFITAHPEFEAIVFANDIMAQIGYRILAKHGKKIGKDILVVGFDNAPFSATLNPPLTTVEANVAELAYVAFRNMDDFLESKSAITKRVRTHYIHRCSCGCLNYDFDSLAEKLQLNEIMNADKYDDIMSHVMNYMFGSYVETTLLSKLKANTSDFVHMLCALTASPNIEDERMEVRTKMTDLIEHSLFSYTSAELFVNFLVSLQFVLERKISDIYKRTEFVKVFSILYQELSKSNFRIYSKHFNSMTQITQIMDEMSADLSRSANMEQIPYKKTIKKLYALGIRSAFLYTYEDSVSHSNGMPFILPDNMLLRTYSCGKHIYAVPEESQRIAISDIFSDDKRASDKRGSFILSPLFSQEELLGILVCETDSEHFSQIPSLATHISSTLKTLLLLEQQREINEYLQTNLEQVRMHNLKLKEISKTDQLTGLYNRRGFMDSIQAITENPMNEGREALVLYADMDGLKTINDKYGHDEGDFALKEISMILKETFRNTDIVSRFGGDEFVAFALLGIPGSSDIIKRRIEEITERHNQCVQKPYRIEMSLGICEILCSKDMDIESVLEQADQKLYVEKKAKKEKRR